MNVLIIEDEAITRRMLEHTLSTQGYRVLTAEDGLEGIEILKQTPCQLVITDWNMPGMDGLEFCHVVRSGLLPYYVYIIMVTSNNRRDDALSGLGAGADDFITKPFNPSELLMRLNTGRRIIGIEGSEMTIFALAKLAESRDSETGAHLERVRAYSKELALELKSSSACRAVVDDNFVRLVYETCPLHDIGKVAIPDRILLNPGKLNSQDFEIMKTHTRCGAETLSAAYDRFPNAEFLKMASEIALSHHEKFDGSGYPDGLVGEAIPLSARVVALADVYDALTSARSYKQAYSHEMARKIILKESNRHFDPVVVDAFVEVEQKFIQIREQDGDRPSNSCKADIPSLTASARSF